MKTFLSYASTDKKVAERLREELEKAGLSVWSDSEMTAGTEWRRRIEDAVSAASHILLLVGPKNGDDPWQQFTWRVALEAVWTAPSKRLIPILLRGATLPAFVLSGTSGKLEAIQVADPRDIRSTAQAVLDLIRGPRIGTLDGKGATIFSVNTDADGGRDTRLSEIADYVQQFIPPSRRGGDDD